MNWMNFFKGELALSKRAIFGLLLLITTGFLGNYFRWTLFFDIDFLFGSIAVWLVVCLYGIGWGTLAGLIAGSCTYVIWHHPYTAFTFTAEALFVGWLFHRRHQNNIVLLDGIFWLVLGMPLVWLIYAVILQVDPTQAQIILFKQPINGLFNALLASLLLTHLPIHRWVNRPPAVSTLSLQQTLFNLLVAFVFVPTLLLIVLASNQVVEDIRGTARSELYQASRYLTVEVETWYERRLGALKELANIAAISSLQPGMLRQSADFTQRTFPDLHLLHVFDATGQQILDEDNLTAGHSANLNASQYFEQMRRSPRPLLSAVLLSNTRLDSPTALLGVPILQAGKFAGAVFSEIDLQGLTQLLRSNVDSQELQLTLVDRYQNVVASTQPQRIGVSNFDWRKHGEIRPIDLQTYHWLPNQGSPVVMVRWNNSRFVREAAIGDSGWTLVLERSATAYVRHIEQVHTKNMALLLVVSGLALVLAVLVSRRLVHPLSQLAAVTTNLPHKLLEAAPIYWIESQITEFALLAQNFRLMATSLQQKFGEIHQANLMLEQRVQERTQALQQTNLELAAEIAERQQIEAALRESEERFRQMAENIQEVFWMQTIHKDRLLYVSPAYEQIWGRTRESLYAAPTSFLEAIHPDDLPHIIAVLSKQIRGEYDEEYRIIQPSGEVRWIWDRAFPIRNAAGEVYRIVGVAKDITERKQAEEQIKQTRNFLQTVIDQLPVALFVKDGRPESFGQHLLWNKTSELMFGVPAEQAIGVTVHALFPPDQADWFIQTDQDVFQRGVPEDIAAESIDSHHLGRRVLHTVKIPLYDEQHHPQYLLCFSEDITARVQAEDALRASEAKYRHLIDNLHAGVVVHAADTQIVLHNSTASELLGFRTDDLTGKTVADPVWQFCREDGTPMSLADYPVSRVIATQQPLRNYMVGIVQSDRAPVWALANAFPEFDAQGVLQQILVTFIDVTDRKRAEEALRNERNLLSRIMDTSPAGIVRVNRAGQITFANRRAEHILGLTKNEMTSRTYNAPEWDIQGLDGLPLPDADLPFSQVVRTEQSVFDYQHAILWPSGRRVLLSINGAPFFNAAGHLDSVVLTVEDITDRKLAEEQVRQQAERERLLGAIALQMRQSLKLEEILNTTVAEVRQFLQTDRVIVYQFQPDWSGLVVVESVAPGWQSILGRHITDTYFAETQGQPYIQGRIFATEDIATTGLAPCHRDLLHQLQVRANLVVPIVQGDRLWGLLVAQHCSAARSWQSSEIDFLSQLAMQAAIAIQQSELYQHEQRLNLILEGQVEERTAQLQQALRYEAMLQRITDKVRDSLDENQILQTAVEELVQGLGVYGCDTALFDLDQSTVTVSHAYTAGVVAPHPEVVLTTNFSDVYPQLLQGQSLQFCELVPRLMDRTWQPRAIFACPIIDDQGILGNLRLFHASETILSEAEIRLVLQVANQCAIAIRQARLYQAAQVQVKVLEELNQLKDDFLSTVSHELRTPISNMKMAIHMLKTMPTEERRARYLEILQSECSREAELINDLLDLQRLASGTKQLDLEPIALSEWLTQAVEPFQERTHSRQQTLQVTLPPNLPAWTSDRLCLNRILAELLNNACKYTPPGETIALTIQMLEPTPLGEPEIASPGPSILQIRVCNTGVEIPESEQSRIFEKFYRIPGIDRWKQGGTGLGLALIQKLIEHVGGTIRVESGHNRTCFVVELLPH